MEGMSVPVRRMFVAADLEGYSRLGNPEQHRAQAILQDVLDRAALEAGLARLEWDRQPSGDGELAVLPSEVDETRVAGRLVPALDRLLRQRNDDVDTKGILRVRVAVHQGLVHLDGASGYPGEAVVHAARLLDAPVLKRALAGYRGAAVALAVSPDIYRDVCSYPGRLRPEWFREVDAEISDKGFSAKAWICVLGEDINQCADLEDAPTAAEKPKKKRRATTPPGGISVRDIGTRDGTVVVGHNSWVGETGQGHDRRAGR